MAYDLSLGVGDLTWPGAAVCRWSLPCCRERRVRTAQEQMTRRKTEAEGFEETLCEVPRPSYTPPAAPALGSWVLVS